MMGKILGEMVFRKLSVLLQEFFFFFFLFRATSVVYGSSQARSQIGAVVAGLYHSHSNEESQMCL